MSMQFLSRSGIALFIVTVVTGCSSIEPDSSDFATAVDPECRRNRQACLYEGSYESGERRYAEEQARRLNQAQSARLRRGIGK